MSHTEKMREALEKIENLSGGDACEYRTIALDGLAKADAIARAAQPAEGGEVGVVKMAAISGDFGTVQFFRDVEKGTKLYTAPPASQEQAQQPGRADLEAAAKVCDGFAAPDMAAALRGQQPSGGEVVAWTESKPKKPGVYGWRGSPASYDMVHVHTRPTEHSPGGQLNGSCLSGKGFYHGCAITSWGGEWIGPLDTLTLATPKPEPMTWQPIATAPKDGTAILVSGGCFIFCVEWNNEFDWWAVDDNKLGPFRLRGAAPTHWMPLPPAPITKEQA